MPKPTSPAILSVIVFQDGPMWLEVNDDEIGLTFGSVCPNWTTFIEAIQEMPPPPPNERLIVRVTDITSETLRRRHTSNTKH